MAATNQTSNLGLPQWVATDKPQRTDFNTAFDAIDDYASILGRPTYMYGREIPFTWAEIKTKCTNNDFSGIAVGDWKSIVVDGETHYMEVAGIDTYYGYTTGYRHCIDFVSRYCLNTTYRYNATNTNIGGWPASELYTTMNGTGGIYDKLPSDVKAVVGPKIMRLENKDGAISSGANWITADKLWLLSDLEVFGFQSWSQIGFGSGNFHQYPIFIGSEVHIIKRTAESSTRTNWWTLSPRSGVTTSFCNVSAYGYTLYDVATAYARIPICFRVLG